MWRRFIQNPGAPMQILFVLVLAGTAYLITGCSTYGPGAGFAALGTHYHHTEWDPETGKKIWETNMFRSWGTSRANTYVDATSEKIGIEGEGMSDNMQDTLGDDVVKNVADVVSKNMRPGGQLEEGLISAIRGEE